MAAANIQTYFSDVVEIFKTYWPDNRLVNIVCHGHSVPAGYFATPFVDTFNAYPHLFHRALKERFPFAAVNVIVTAIGGENSAAGAKRFESEVLTHRPDVITIDYALNDRQVGLQPALGHWTRMIETARENRVKVILLTPSWDNEQIESFGSSKPSTLERHAEQIRMLADKHGTAIVDSFAAFERYAKDGQDVSKLLSWPNHPNREGHTLITTELMRWFAAR